METAAKRTNMLIVADNEDPGLISQCVQSIDVVIDPLAVLSVEKMLDGVFFPLN